LPAPVTMATRPSNLIVMRVFPGIVDFVMPGLDTGICQSLVIFDQ
jgi:hypothetical protein